MKIVHLSSAPPSGGAARAGFRLHEGLRRLDRFESEWLEANDCGVTSDRKGALEKLWKGSWRKSFGRRLWKRRLNRHFPGSAVPVSSPCGWGAVDALPSRLRPDVWNLHWVAWFLEWEEMLLRMSERAPVVWTLHDLNPLRGVWHYAPEEDDVTPMQKRLETKAVELRRQALQKVPRERLTFVGPSRWMEEECRRSPVTMGFPVQRIPYGLDTKRFRPREGALLRAMFGIPESAFLIGFLADDLTDTRKGIQPLREALAEIAREKIPVHLITAGSGSVEEVALPHTQVGSISSDVLLSYFYSACDLFVCPSLQDNLPNTVLESLACGTPVVGYHTGGLPDMISRERRTGITVEPVGDAEALAAAIIELVEDRALVEEMAAASREVAERDYSLEVQARTYGELYRSLNHGN